MHLRISTAVALFLIPAPAWAWWNYAHETIAAIAERSSKPRTIREIRRLLANSNALETPLCPIRTIGDAATWPDCIKRYGDRFSYSSSSHYQNVDICRSFDLVSACKDGNCVSAQIERHAKHLGNKALPESERLTALAFLIHFVGDLHMPLHAADRGDRGGNDFTAAYGVIGGKTNLHMIWDGYLAERAISTPRGEAGGILSELSAEDRVQMRKGTVVDWSRESWQAGRDQAYGSLGSGSCGATSKARAVVDERTTQRLIPIVRRQIARAGLRLARLLDEALG